MQLDESTELLNDMRRLGIVEPRDYVVDLDQCHGMTLVTIKGRQIHDWAGYYGSRLIGHNHPSFDEPEIQRKLLRAAVNKVSNPDFVTRELVDYYRTLAEIAPVCLRNPNMKIYTINSGAEAVENALKYCVNRWQHKNPNRGTVDVRFMNFTGGFHGRTVYALSVTDMPHNPTATRDYRQLTNVAATVEFPEERTQDVARALNYAESTFKLHGADLAGVIVEPMQGAGGHRTSLPEFFQGISRLANQYDVPLIFDEVQTAGGQTGTFWMCDQFDLPYSPTCVVSAKKLGCGVIYMKEPIKDAGVLDSTWSGHIVDMVRFVHEMKIIREERLMEKLPTVAKALRDGLNELALRSRLVTQVRGAGTYLGFTVGPREERNALVQRLLNEHDTLVLGAGIDSIRLRPSLSATVTDVDRFLYSLMSVL